MRQVLASFYRRCGAPPPAFEFGTGEDEERRPVRICMVLLKVLKTSKCGWCRRPPAARRRPSFISTPAAARSSALLHPAFQFSPVPSNRQIHLCEPYECASG